jgi:NTP pyrophosphatase (non-canonical NTP hydrolase)
MTFKEYQKKVDQWIKTIGVRYFSELTNMAILAEEVGELARLVSRKYGDQSFKNPKEAQGVEEKLADELADILWVTTCLANQMGVNLEAALEKNMQKKTQRDKDRHRENEKLK